MSAAPAANTTKPEALEQAWAERERVRKNAQRLAQSVLEDAQSTALEQAKAQIVLAYLAFRQGSLGEALERHSAAAPVLQTHNDTLWLARAMDVRVCATLELGDFHNGALALAEQLRLGREAHDLEMEGSALHNLGMVELMRGTGKAEPFLQLALEIFARGKLVEGQAFAKLNLADACEQNGQLQRAQTLLNEALEMALTHGIPFVETCAVAQQGRLAIAQERFADAEILLENALKRGEQNQERVLWEVIPALVQVHLHFARPHEAIRLLEDQLRVLQTHGMQVFEVAAHRLLADVLSEIGEDRAALTHYRKHLELHHHMFNEANQERTRALGLLSQIQTAEREAENERQKNVALRAAYTELERLHQHVLTISFTDELTQAHNRRSLMTEGQALVQEAAGCGASVALLDLDHFKRINDTFGHDGGDAVLREFAQVTQDNLRSCDFFARFGGEEFAIVFPDTNLDTAHNVLMRIRTVFAGRVWQALPNNERVTFTAGLTDATNGDLMQALRRADALLYVGKSQGRNGIWR